MGAASSSPKGVCPPAPAQPILEAVDASRLRVKWQVPECTPVATHVGVGFREQGSIEWELWDHAKNRLAPAAGDADAPPATQQECIIDGLVSNKWYEAKVAAKNDAGWGEWSAISQLLLSNVPPAPAALTMQAVSSTSLRVQWKVPVCTPVVTHVAVSFRDVEDDWKVWDHSTKRLVVTGGDAAPATACECVIEDLEVGRRYEAKMMARNDVGWGDWSPISPPFWLGEQMDHGWSLHPVLDEDTKAALDKMMEVTKPEDLGTGRDVAHGHGRAYKDIKIHSAWRIENPNMWQRYCGQRSFVAQKVQQASAMLGFGPLPFQVGAYTRLIGASRQLAGALDKDAGEGHFLHGSRPEYLLQILDSGLNARVASLGGAFGVGVYLAEDVEKIDQYATPDSGSDPGLEDLHARLFRPGGHCHPNEDIFYCIIVRAVLGASVVTRGMSRTAIKSHFDADDESKQIFVDKDRRELVAIPGTKPPIRYHSLIVEKGKAVKRFREFVVMDGTNCYAEYLVAYKRV
eukprot:CAMPEP_0172838690 /NCGR_PEP_ID=MMETSP1075-20121228/28046_1 /TAXON_ID=2916 /ORGANISM="Ceratium fusus, Strain PA161109" /LENGTH=515 /DNA_ID=CAMNT_0013682237 /DNA_START=55 /DNA_END=1602 /DNA_ORIENTATION=+